MNTTQEDEEKYKIQLLKFYQEENLQDHYKEAECKWYIVKLFQDLEAQKKNDEPRQKGLGKFEKKYLCLLLAGIKQQEISNLNIYSTKSLGSEPSRKIYPLIGNLTGKKINSSEDILISLVDKGYRKSCGLYRKVTNEKQALIIVKCEAEISEASLTHLEMQFKNVIEVDTLFLNHITKGCMKTYWQGSQADCAKIEALYNLGLLSERLGVPVLEVRVIPIEERNILTQWLENIFNQGWQVVEELLNPQQLIPTTWSDQIKRAKLITDLTQQIVLVITIRERETSPQFNIGIEVYPKDQQALPKDLTLQMLTDEENISLQAIALENAPYIECRFNCDYEDKFIIKLIESGIEVREYFTI
ncbi:hypothetical protein B9G53_05900 [Pseudanabaena sp. SR411]|uniref:DUF1822 family protein n=1 Tax=Pseudanabaena sp. SR411 TaxID=1980935 RepID=UPI000B98B175|nr:DUF1822 family protein [Pseudanabaena sp. SR411]OYQ65934.1 hypothetical protein B9G53_05900 [Pseudanabaena sp. SR411]